MGFLGRLLGGDPQRDLERARAALNKDDLPRALELAQRAVEKGAPEVQAEAGMLVTRARETLIAHAFDKASQAEASGFLEDAEEWLSSALPHAEDGRRSEIEKRLGSVRERLAERERLDEVASLEHELGVGGEVETDGEEGSYEVGLDDHFQALTGMLRDDVADRYDAQPAPFRQAVVGLSEGRADEAVTVLESLLAPEPDDPVLRLERGRVRLVAGDPSSAVDDFEIAWRTFGDAPLDVAGAFSVPSLWAEASLAAGHAKPVIERLTSLAEPSEGREDLVALYGQALLLDSRLEEAKSYLLEVLPRMPGVRELPLLLAQSLVALGDRRSAVDCLESAIAPSCVSGNCAKPPLHRPSVRALIGLYLENGAAPDRVRELLGHLARAQQGQLGKADQALLARFYEQQGDTESAARVRAEAERLADRPESEALPGPSGGKAVL